MAEVVLTGDFTPDMARDYGCGGRGYFDAYSYMNKDKIELGHETFAGYYVDATDFRFYRWKKCVRCASNNSARLSKHLYEYDPDTDTCGK